MKIEVAIFGCIAALVLLLAFWHGGDSSATPRYQLLFKPEKSQAPATVYLLDTATGRL